MFLNLAETIYACIEMLKRCHMLEVNTDLKCFRSHVGTRTHGESSFKDGRIPSFSDLFS